MTRIYAVLAILSTLFLVATLVVGLVLDGASARADDVSQSWMTAHFLMGTFAAIGVVLVQSLGVTYFVGTGRWCKEVIQTYRLDASLFETSRRLKHRTFPWAVSAMLIIVGVIALGAACDPATGRADTHMWRSVHYLAACCGATVIAITYGVVWSRIRANQAIIDAILAQVQTVRRNKGLDTACAK